MVVEILRASNLDILLPVMLLLIGTYLILFKTKKKVIIQQDKNDIISSYAPEPLIDLKDINTEHNFEVLMPDENSSNCLNLAQVNYLNLLSNKDLRKEAESCIKVYGVGPCGPRGFYGTIDVHLDLEVRIAEYMNMEETVLYSYGFSTISSAVGAYCTKSDIIFCDEEINFCIKQGILAARSKAVYFKHNDMSDLKTKLEEYDEKEKKSEKQFRKFLIVEGIYAASGTICPLPELMDLREKHKLRIFIDESISFGVLGRKGKGVTEHFGINRSDVDMIMGSLEWSLGSIGGFCVGASFVIEHQRLSGLGYFFSASLPPFLSHVTICALNLMENNGRMFDKLRSISCLVDKKLRKLKKYFVLSDPLSPLKVIAIRTKENQTEIIRNIHSLCTERNIYLIPTEKSLQFNIHTATSHSDINRIMSVLKEAL